MSLPKKVEDWTTEQCQNLSDQLHKYYRRYNIDTFYVIGSRCNGIEDADDVDISLDVKNDIVQWRNLSGATNRAELLKRALYEQRIGKSFGEKFNIIVEWECSQKLYKTIEKLDMPYFDLKTQTLYNRNIGEMFPYKVITYNYDKHIFYVKLRKENLTPEEINYFTEKIYSNLSPVINSTVSLGEADKSFIADSPYNIISYLINLTLTKKDMDSESKQWIKNNSRSLQGADYGKLSDLIEKGINSPNSDLFVKLFHDCEIYENLSVF